MNVKEEKPQQKMCSSCERDLPLSDFGNNRSAPDGLQRTCRVCLRMLNRRRRIAGKR